MVSGDVLDSSDSFIFKKSRGLEGGYKKPSNTNSYPVEPLFRGINKRVRPAKIKSLLLKPIQNGSQLKLTSRLTLTDFHC